MRAEASKEAAAIGGESQELSSKKTYKEVSKRKTRKDRIDGSRDVLIEVGENARERNSDRNRAKRSRKKSETEK